MHCHKLSSVVSSNVIGNVALWNAKLLWWFKRLSMHKGQNLVMHLRICNRETKVNT